MHKEQITAKELLNLEINEHHATLKDLLDYANNDGWFGSKALESDGQNEIKTLIQKIIDTVTKE